MCALYTKLTKKQITKLVTNYNLDAPLSIKGIVEGTVNTYYRLRYPDQVYYLKIDEIGDLARLKNELEIFKNLEKSQKRFQFNIPLLVPTKAKKAYLKFKQKYLLLFKEVKGQSLTVAQLKPRHLTQVGQALARLHYHTRQKTYKPHRFHLGKLNRLFKEIKPKLDKKHPDVSLFCKELLKQLKSKQPQTIASGLIHADLFSENILFEKDKLAGILDFEAAGHGAYLFDIATAIHALCYHQHHFLLPHAKALLKGYTQIRRLTKTETKNLPYYLNLSALRFLLTRLTDFELKPKTQIKSKTKNFRDYYERFEMIEGLVKKLVL